MRTEAVREGGTVVSVGLESSDEARLRPAVSAEQILVHLDPLDVRDREVIGVKTGSDRLGRRLFRLPGHPLDRRQADHDHRVMLGQPGYDQVTAGLAAAAAMVDRIAGDRATPDLRPPTLPPLAAPGSQR